ncbi:MAG TPA: hypothetical protein PLA94_05925, partial [Myxococcota bacterium]|nr:hypothetical protein [Myxococcota bacterium]
IGFATTDFIITMTLSAADAAEHAVKNHYLEHYLEGHQFGLTNVLLALLAVVFLRGFREAIGVATVIAVPYLILSGIVVGTGLYEVATHPEAWNNWTMNLSLKGGFGPLAVAALLTFPKLALGLSGFETGVTVMPLVKGDPADEHSRPAHGPRHGEAPAPTHRPEGRIRNTRYLLAAAAMIMSVFLISSSIVTTMLIPETAWQEGGDASGRALAWLAEHLIGPNFATLYDIFTVLILWFAGASAMAAMLSLIPRYLPRFGMAPHWVSHPRPLILVLFAITLLVTWIFDANVEAQGGAYATGVLALIFSAAVAVTLAQWSEAVEERRTPWRALPYALITAVFAFTLVDNVIERPDGIIISSVFIGSIVVLGAISRYYRATEFRVEKLAFERPEDEELFHQLRGKKVHLLTVKHTETGFWKHRKRIQQYYKLDGPVAFLHVELASDRSRFDSTIYVRVGRIGENDYRISVSNSVAVANTVAYISELLDPIAIFLGLTQVNPVTQAFRYLLWGEGETGVLVYQILLRYWSYTPEEDVKPRIFLMSD